MFAFTVVKLKEVYDYLSEPTQIEQTVDNRPNVDSVITKVDTGLVCE